MQTETIAARAAELRVPLSQHEIEKLQSEISQNHGGRWREYLRMIKEKRSERQALLDWICRSDGSSYGARTIVLLDCAAASLLAGIGVIYAGQAGMNVIGSAVTGCVAALAGGTLSNGMTGAVSRGGVFWVKDPRYLALSLGASIATFTLMPKYEEKVRCCDSEATSSRRLFDSPGVLEYRLQLSRFARLCRLESVFLVFHRTMLTLVIVSPCSLSSGPPTSSTRSARALGWRSSGQSV